MAMGDGIAEFLAFLIATAWYSCATVSGEVPFGHMKVLGSHKPPTVILDEITAENAPTPKDFFEKYVKPSKAAIFRGVVKESDAFKLWTDEYIQENFGNMEVRLEAKWEKHHLPPAGEKYLGRDSLLHFVDHYHEPDSVTYIVSDLPSPMYHDMVVIPSLGACGEMSRHITEVNLWWSGGNSRSILHKDAYNQMNCLLNGTKYWKLIEYKYEKYVYKHPEPDKEVGGFSDVNPREVDLVRYPNFAKVEWANFTINAGDCLFLPKSDYHQVDSYGTHNLAVSILFGRFDNRDSLDFSDCDEHTDYQKMRRLSEFHVQWAWSGTGMMVMGNSDLEDEYRMALIRSIQEHGGRLTHDAMRRMFEMDDIGLNRLRGDSREGFRVIDKNGDGELTEDEVLSLTIDELRKFAIEVEEYEPSNSYNFEYSIISYHAVYQTLKHLLDQYETIQKNIWIRAYQDLGGTEVFADEIFSRLRGPGSAIVSEYVTESEIEYALENWKFHAAPQYTPDPDREDNIDSDYSYFQTEYQQDYYDADESELFEKEDLEKDEL